MQFYNAISYTKVSSSNDIYFNETYFIKIYF